MSCGLGHRHSSDLALLWCRLAATTPIAVGTSICHGAIVAQWVRNLIRVCEDVFSIPGLAQLVKDLALPQAVA